MKLGKTNSSVLKHKELLICYIFLPLLNVGRLCLIAKFDKQINVMQFSHVKTKRTKNGNKLCYMRIVCL